MDIVQKLGCNLSERKAQRPDSTWVWLRLVTGWLSFLLASAGLAQTNLPPAPVLLTSFNQMWTLTGEVAQKPQHIRAEAVLLFYDADWMVAFGVCDGRFNYLPIATSKLPLRAGQRILLDGSVIPAREVFSWDKTQVKVLDENVPLPATFTSFLNRNSFESGTHLFWVDGVIDQDRVADSNHLVLTVQVADQKATVNVHLHTPNQAVPFKSGDLVRIKALIIPTFTISGNVTQVTLWVDGAENVQIIRSIAKDPRFAIPATSVAQFEEVSSNQIIRVAGVVRGYEPGKSVTMWDGTGVVTIQSSQTQLLGLGDRIEAIGNAQSVGIRNYLHSATYRMAATNELAHGSGATTNTTLFSAAQIQSLGPEEVKRHPPVKLRAILAWNQIDTPFIYAEDSSGCVRVVNPNLVDTNLSIGTILNIRGEAAAGPYVPVVTNAVITHSGLTSQVAPEQIDLDQALSGAKEGHMVEMRAFVRNASMEGSLIHLELSTSQGEFRAWVPNNGASMPWVGAIVHIRGICSAISNDRHQLTGVELWVPGVEAIQIEEKAPDDVFAFPFRSLVDLGRFHSEEKASHRVRTVGTVVLQEPGRYLYVQDGTASIFVLSEQKDFLKPGDRVEVVGFPGNEGRRFLRFLLRDANFRRIDKGVDPIPFSLPDRHFVTSDLEGLLARSKGKLLDAVQKDGQARLLIQSAGYTFEARLDSPDTLSTDKLKGLPLNSTIEVTGVYEVQSDEYGHPASFSLNLRTWDDAVLLERPPWWTLSRLLGLLLIVAIGSVTTAAWGYYISRKNAQLEDRVLTRTGELREQVKVKEQALSDLAQTQQRLMLASRQAGMAEVATSVLHNVGNVLNSVNVSTCCLRDRVENLPVDYVGKAAALLSQPDGQLANFLTEDPRGRQVPEFLTKLGENLTHERLELKSEIESLAKSVEHINVIVSMQQNHAKLSGILEEQDVRSVVEDAIQMNSVDYDRDAIELVRDFQPVPTVLVDRHKVMQILINLLVNANHALAGKSSGKKVSVCILAPMAGCVRISVTDNGCGIAKENLGRIFSQGFTTRKDGHGYGLHNGALAAKEMGGSLVVQSAGPDQGATFTLEIPPVLKTPIDTKSVLPLASIWPYPRLTG